MTRAATAKAPASLVVPDFVAHALRREGAIYVGAAIVQAPGSWTRCGPTWFVPGVGWVNYGPGVDRWGTTRGLAQLASDADATPTWHAVGWSICPVPSLVFAVLREALEAKHMVEVAKIVRAAQSIEVGP